MAILCKINEDILLSRWTMRWTIENLIMVTFEKRYKTKFCLIFDIRLARQNKTKLQKRKRSFK